MISTTVTWWVNDLFFIDPWNGLKANPSSSLAMGKLACFNLLATPVFADSFHTVHLILRMLWQWPDTRVESLAALTPLDNFSVIRVDRSCDLPGQLIINMKTAFASPFIHKSPIIGKIQM